MGELVLHLGLRVADSNDEMGRDHNDCFNAHLLLASHLEVLVEGSVHLTLVLPNEEGGHMEVRRSLPRVEVGLPTEDLLDDIPVL